ncbi:13819_t:CDS:2 [Ambispora leptoticha]|uniref:13819_t:CDS:1 n=1 Tax=Ambispora leptoticha TaxID=144679 RepID=A0A9N9DDN2_9GLOM|nr:13819_t:CDS:2 [Ambispora leptoticha]
MIGTSSKGNIEANSEKFYIDVNTSNTIDSLEEKIFDEVKKKNNDIFSDIKASDLKLWKVQIRNDKEDDFSSLDLQGDEKDMKILRGITGNYWKKQPSEEFTHIIVDSPLLVARRGLRERDIQIQDRDESLDLLNVFHAQHDKLITDNLIEHQDLDILEDLRTETKRFCYALVANRVSWTRMVAEIGTNPVRTKSIDKRTLQKFCSGETKKPDDEVLLLIKAWVIKQREEEVI